MVVEIMVIINVFCFLLKMLYVFEIGVVGEVFVFVWLDVFWLSGLFFVMVLDVGGDVCWKEVGLEVWEILKGIIIILYVWKVGDI